MGAEPGWYEDAKDPLYLRYWDGVAWTDDYAPRAHLHQTKSPDSQPRGDTSHGGVSQGVPREQVAHGIAMAYINNRYSAEVTGEFSVSSSTSSEVDAVNDVTGQGSVQTKKHPGLHDPEMVRVGTGQRHFLGMGPEKTQLVPTGKYEVDRVLKDMIDEYYTAYWRILDLLDRREVRHPSTP